MKKYNERIVKRIAIELKFVNDLLMRIQCDTEFQSQFTKNDLGKLASARVYTNRLRDCLENKTGMNVFYSHQYDLDNYVETILATIDQHYGTERPVGGDR